MAVNTNVVPSNAQFRRLTLPQSCLCHDSISGGSIAKEGLAFVASPRSLCYNGSHERDHGGLSRDV